MLCRSMTSSLQAPKDPDLPLNPIVKTKKELVEDFKKIPQKIEEMTVNIATEIFSRNRQLRRQDPDVSALRYVGIEDHIYCCMAAIPEGSTYAAVFSVDYEDSNMMETEDFYVIKLSIDQARGFDAVKRLDMDTASCIPSVGL